LDNAGKWARSRVILRVLPTEGGAFLTLCVDDDGPGLPAHQREQAVKRGRRLDETKPGSGLGLSIVADLAAVYAGSFHLEDAPEGGLRACLRLPAA
jgi:signal transduction histidine kinase